MIYFMKRREEDVLYSVMERMVTLPLEKDR